jgi:lysophospholipid acyltransferase (LPLAT)-like uncharacterized protein
MSADGRLPSERRQVWLGRCAALLIRMLGRSWRVRLCGQPDVAPRIYALLHGHMLLPAFRLRRSRSVVMISRHRDGELIAQAVSRIGFTTVRGSSTRGAPVAVRDLLRGFGDRPWVVTPDGPKGPRGSVKEGLIRLAQESCRPIQPMAGAARPAHVFGSWDRFVLPWPFARVVVCFGAPMPVPLDLDDAGREALARELERRLVQCEEDARSALRDW